MSKSVRQAGSRKEFDPGDASREEVKPWKKLSKSLRRGTRVWAWPEDDLSLSGKERNK